MLNTNSELDEKILLGNQLPEYDNELRNMSGTTKIHDTSVSTVLYKLIYFNSMDTPDDE